MEIISAKLRLGNPIYINPQHIMALLPEEDKAILTGGKEICLYKGDAERIAKIVSQSRFESNSEGFGIIEKTLRNIHEIFRARLR